jgi:hypothetical protein
VNRPVDLRIYGSKIPGTWETCDMVSPQTLVSPALSLFEGPILMHRFELEPFLPQQLFDFGTNDGLVLFGMMSCPCNDEDSIFVLFGPALKKVSGRIQGFFQMQTVQIDFSTALPLLRRQYQQGNFFVGIVLFDLPVLFLIRQILCFFLSPF